MYDCPKCGGRGIKSSAGNWCRPCEVKRVRVWKQANRERARQAGNAARRRKKDRDREAHRAARREERKRRFERDPEGVRAAYRRNYRNNPDRYLRNYRRRSRRLIFRGLHTARDWARLCARYRFRCAYCNTHTTLTRDHVVPLSRGGTNFIGNIVPACRSCNSRKGTKLLSEWRLASGGIRKA